MRNSKLGTQDPIEISELLAALSFANNVKATVALFKATKKELTEKKRIKLLYQFVFDKSEIESAFALLEDWLRQFNKTNQLYRTGNHIYIKTADNIWDKDEAVAVKQAMVTLSVTMELLHTYLAAETQ